MIDRDTLWEMATENFEDDDEEEEFFDNDEQPFSDSPRMLNEPTVREECNFYNGLIIVEVKGDSDNYFIDCSHPTTQELYDEGHVIIACAQCSLCDCVGECT